MSEDSPSRTYRAIVEAEPRTAARIAELLDEALNAAGDPFALSVSYFECPNGLFEVSALYDSPPDATRLQALIDSAADGTETSALRVEEVPDANWVKISQAQRGPVRAGRFVIHGSHDRERIAQNRFTIEIDADQAFGTAHHATTRGCLLALDQLAKRGRPDLVLDIGTGTGILAIAAALAFDRPVVATDNDPVAVLIAEENAAKAGVRQSIHLLVAEGLSHPTLLRLAPDLIMANILARPLYQLAPDMARIVQPGGYVLLSGITGAQAAATVARYASLGFVLEKRILLDGWATLLLGRRNASTLLD
ncbi:MAG: 50S ribosomal protein L11 methyltransferase [Methyloceanibacter sp.]|nr:50S ribosomal protein L11 methyltransferase [Methyloceanibacter sp.]